MGAYAPIWGLLSVRGFMRICIACVLMSISSLAWAGQQNLLTWFRGGEYAAKYHNDVPLQLPKPLADFIASKIGKIDNPYHLTKEDFVGCYGSDPEEYQYTLQLAPSGIEFDVPVTQNGSCGEFFVVSFQELRPYINKIGLRKLDLLKHHKPSNSTPNHSL